MARSLINIQPHSLIVFDSGIGGLSILRQLLALPCPLTYFADQKYFPYGSKNPQWLESRLTHLAQSFAATYPLGLVIACNTGTVSSISAIRRLVTYPVFGVEPVTKPIARFHHPVVWGTPSALTSPHSASLLTRYGSHIRYYSPPNLASAIEYQDYPQIHQILAQAQAELGKPDAIGLSCTHYPLIESLIQQYFPASTLIEPSLAVASQVQKLLFPHFAPAPHSSPINFISTLSSVNLTQLAPQYL